MKRSKNPDKFLSLEESTAVDDTIKHAEKRTSAEIKLFISRHCWMDIKEKASKIFKKLGLYKTKQRNCVLVLLVLTNQEFLIYGDQGIHEKVGQNFWNDVKDVMSNSFKKDLFGEGLCKGIKLIGEKLSQYFPPQPCDINEISDKIEYEK